MKKPFKCYMCDADGITREHVPPVSFFPIGYRENLVTVPACHEHNTKNSKDVEYVRNIIVTHITTNETARGHFQNMVIRSFKHSPKLLTQTFDNVTSKIINGDETGVIRLDMPRFKLVMNAIAHAIFYKEFDKTYPRDWEIFSRSLLSASTLYEGVPDGWEQERIGLEQVLVADVLTPQPKVFRYGKKKWSEEEVLYRFLFYEGFIVETIALKHT
jgi:hypothetical protein